MTLVRLVVHEARDALEGRVTVSAGRVQLLHGPFQGDFCGKVLAADIALLLDVRAGCACGAGQISLRPWSR